MTKLENSTKSVGRGAGFMAIGTVSSRFLGLFRDMVIAYGFDVTTIDAWLVAFRIPNSLRRIFGEGAFSAALIPELVSTRENGGELAVKKTAGGVFSLLALVLFTISVFGILFPESFIPFFTDGQGFTSIPGKIENTIRFTRIMFFFLFFICNFAFFMAILNSYKEFFWPGFAPVLFNLTMIVFALMPQTWVLVSGDLLAYGVLIGGFLQMLVLLPILKRKAFIPRFGSIIQPRVLKVVRNMVPGVISLGVLQLMTLVNVKFAAQLPNGANSWLYFADRLLEFPLSLISVSLGTALLPTLSEYWAKNDSKSLVFELSNSLQLTMFLALPAAVGLFFLAEDLIHLFFGRGKYTTYDVIQTAVVLQVYSVSLIVYSLVRVSSSAYYATKKYWFPVLGTVLGLLVHYFSAPYWMNSFGVQGLALSTLIGGAVNLVVVFAILQVKIGSCFIKNHMMYLFKTLICSSILALLLYFSTKLSVFPKGSLYQSGMVLFQILVAVIVYMFCAEKFGIPYAKEILRILRRKTSL